MEEEGEGQWHSSGEGRRCGGMLLGSVSVQFPPPPNNKVGVMARMENLAQNCPKLPRPTTWLLHGIWEPQTQSTGQRLGLEVGVGGQDCQRLTL